MLRPCIYMCMCVYTNFSIENELNKKKKENGAIAGRKKMVSTINVSLNENFNEILEAQMLQNIVRDVNFP